MEKKLMKGCEVYMGRNSGCPGYGNIQCVSSVCEPLGTISLYGHNQNYKMLDVSEIVSSPEVTTKSMENLLQNQIDLLKEDIECSHLYLDDKGIPRKSKLEKQTYSIVGRIKLLESNYQFAASKIESYYLNQQQ